MMHTLTTAMVLPCARAQVFAFFAEATNLARITPPELRFTIVTPGSIHLSEGIHIEYRLQLFGSPFSWHTEIQRWKPPEAFVEQGSTTTPEESETREDHGSPTVLTVPLAERESTRQRTYVCQRVEAVP